MIVRYLSIIFILLNLTSCASIGVYKPNKDFKESQKKFKHSYYDINIEKQSHIKQWTASEIEQALIKPLRKAGLKSNFQKFTQSDFGKLTTKLIINKTLADIEAQKNPSRKKIIYSDLEQKQKQILEDDALTLKTKKTKNSSDEYMIKINLTSKTNGFTLLSRFLFGLIPSPAIHYISVDATFLKNKNKIGTFNEKIKYTTLGTVLNPHSKLHERHAENIGKGIVNKLEKLMDNTTND